MKRDRSMSDFPNPDSVRHQEDVRALNCLKGYGVTEQDIATLHHFGPTVQTCGRLIALFGSESRQIAAGARGRTNRKSGARTVYLKTQRKRATCPGKKPGSETDHLIQTALNRLTQRPRV
jgi:hypothetical protein